MKKRVTGQKRTKRPEDLRLDAKHQRNVCRRLESRLFGSAFRPDFRRERFSGFSLVREIDNTPRASEGPAQSSKIIEIISTTHFLFILTKSGSCFAHSHQSAAVHYLNTSPDEVVRSIFHNTLNDSLVMITVDKDDGYSSLRCRSLPIAYIQRNRLSEWLEPFVNEALSWPGFIEFDEINDHVLTFSAKTNTYKIWEMKNYALLYGIPGDDVKEVKISSGLLLLVSHPTATHIAFRMLSADSGQEVSHYRHALRGDSPIEFVELFSRKLFIKQETTTLLIFDVYAQTTKELEFVKPSGFIFLHERNVFVTLRQGLLSTWDLDGKLITKFEDHQLWGNDFNSAIHITRQQDFIVSLCSGGGFFDEGTINISDVISGKCLAKIGGGDDTRQERERARAMHNITALHFSEERNEIYTGNKAGLVHIWAN